MTRSFLCPVLLLFLSLCLCLSCVSGEIIIHDLFDNEVGLPLTGGNATGGYTIVGATVVTSPYYLYVSITDEVEAGQSNPTTESFYMNSAPGAFCQGNLVNQTFQATTLVDNVPVPTGPVIIGTFTGSPASPNYAAGIYIFTFIIPESQAVCVNITYNSTAPSVIDRIYISVTNPNSTGLGPPTPQGVVGDPQFVGLRGQSYQIHGIDGAIYNILSEKNTQINARFVFLSHGECPIFAGIPDINCWSHPGSYLGEIGIQQIVDGINHQALIIAGPARRGFQQIILDGRPLEVGDVATYSSFSVNYTTSHRAIFTTEHFTFDLSNSDWFINQAVSALVSLSTLKSHGLLGQTHSMKVYPNSFRYIEGSVDDYIIDEDQIFGTDFVYNRFTA